MWPTGGGHGSRPFPRCSSRTSWQISQETLAEIHAISRERFMNKFRNLGLIDCNGHLEIHGSLLNVVLHDEPHTKK